MRITRPKPVTRYRRPTRDRYPFGYLDLPLHVDGSIEDTESFRPAFRPRASLYEQLRWSDWTLPRAVAARAAIRGTLPPHEVGWRVALHDDTHPFDLTAAFADAAWRRSRHHDEVVA